MSSLDGSIDSLESRIRELLTSGGNATSTRENRPQHMGYSHLISTVKKNILIMEQPCQSHHIFYSRQAIVDPSEKPPPKPQPQVFSHGHNMTESRAPMHGESGPLNYPRQRIYPDGRSMGYSNVRIFPKYENGSRLCPSRLNLVCCTPQRSPFEMTGTHSSATPLAHHLSLSSKRRLRPEK